MFVPFALLAAVLFATSTVLQHRAASTAAAGLGPFRLMSALLRDRRWLGGKVADLAATACQAVALRSGSLLGVQVLVTCGVPLALGMGAVVEHRPLRRDEQRGAIAVMAGVGALVLVASGGGRTRATLLALVVTGAVVLASAAALHAADAPPWLLGLGGGAAFTSGSAMLKAGIARVGHVALWSPQVVLPLAGFLAVAVAGNSLVQRAFHRAPLRRSLPALTAAEPVTALLLGRMLFGERLSGHAPGAALLVLGLASLVYGLVVTSTVDASP